MRRLEGLLLSDSLNSVRRKKLFISTWLWDLFSRGGRFWLARTSSPQGHPMGKSTPWRERERDRERETQSLSGHWSCSGTWRSMASESLPTWRLRLSTQALETALRDLWVHGHGLVWLALLKGSSFEHWGAVPKT